MATPNLWGELPSIDDIRAPITVLKEQAAQLQIMTRGVLRARVMNKQEGGWFTLELRIVAPAIENYEFTVLETRHSIGGYPLEVTPSWRRGRSDSTIECADEGEFVKALGDILASDRVRQVIRSLLAQSKALGKSAK